MDKEAKIFHKKLKRIEHCEKITGKETIEQLATLMFTPQGREFCIENNFPAMEDLLKIKGERTKELGVIIDSNLEFENRENIAIFGGTVKLRYNEIKRCRVLAMHGANVHIIAENYAIVLVESRGAKVVVTKKGNAKVVVR